MCTLAVFVQAFVGTPLVVAANRDEKLDRPSGPPRISTQGNLQVLAPIDLLSGGTWLGVNSAGVFVGLTNRFGIQPDPARRSRGFIVQDALTAHTAADAYAHASAMDPAANTAFHLVMADAVGAYLVWSDGARLSRSTLGPGLHIVTERSFGAAPTTREGLLQDKLSTLAAPDVGGMQDALRMHADNGFEGTCVHVAEMGYGTKSSTIVVMSGSETEVWHADGPPCRVAYERVTWPAR